MSKVKLQWKAQASSGVSYRIHRDTKHINITEPLPPLLTTTSDTFYEDTTASFGETYYYIIQTIDDATGDVRSTSSNIAVSCLENVYVADSGSIKKIDVYSNEIWSATIGSTVSNMQTDGSGNVIYFTTSGKAGKLDHEGNSLWEETIASSIKDMVVFAGRVHCFVNDNTTFTTGYGLIVLNINDGSVVNTSPITNPPVSAVHLSSHSFVITNKGDVHKFNENGSQVFKKTRPITTTGVVEISATNDKLVVVEDNAKITFIDAVDLLNSEDPISRNVSSVIGTKDNELFFIETDKERNIRKVQDNRYNGWGSVMAGATKIAMDASKNITTTNGTEVRKFNNKGEEMWRKTFTAVEAITSEPSRRWL